MIRMPRPGPGNGWRCTLSARRQLLADHPNLVLEQRAQRRVGLPQHQVAAGLDDARLLGGHPPPPVTDAVGVVTAHVGDHRHLPVRHVGGVEAAEQSHLDHRHAAHAIVREQVADQGGTEVKAQGDGFLIVLTVLFLLFEASVLPGKLKMMHEASTDHRSVSVFTAFVDSMQRYVFLKTVLSIGLGTLVSLVLWGLGVRYPLLWGLLAFLLNFVPNIGAFLAAVPPILLALLQGGWPLFWYTGSVLFVIHFVTGNIVEPVLMGERLGLSTLVVFVSLILWGWVLGPVGMLLSVPLTMIIRIGLEAYPQTRWIAVLLGPAPSDGHANWVLSLWHKIHDRPAH